MPRVVHFEIHADQPERAVRFYKELFDWQFHKWEGPMDYWLIVTGPDGQPGINGGLIARSARSTATASLPTSARSTCPASTSTSNGPLLWVARLRCQNANSERRLAGLLQRPGKQRLRPDAIRQAGAAAAVDRAGASARRIPAGRGGRVDRCQRRTADRQQVGGGSLDAAMREQLLGRRHVADVERPELGVAGTGLVEPHPVDDVLEEFGIPGPQRHAPFPIVEAQAHGD